MSPCVVPSALSEITVSTPETVPVLSDGIKSKDPRNVKEEKDYTRGEESTDEQASTRESEESTDEGSSCSDSDSSLSTRKRTSMLSASESPSRRGSEASTALPEDITELLPSVGSVGHFTGVCSRCCFFPKGRCSNGADCTFCHLEHDRRLRHSKRGGSKNMGGEAESASASEAESTTFQAAAPVAIAKPPGLATPVASAKPMVLPVPLPPFACALTTVAIPLQVQKPHEGQDAEQIRRVSAGRPVKVWLPVDETQSSKKLHRGIPAHKRPPYPEFVATSRPVLDPSQPVKKRVPVFSEGFLQGMFDSQPQCASVSARPALAAVVPTVRAALVPR